MSLSARSHSSSSRNDTELARKSSLHFPCTENCLRENPCPSGAALQCKKSDILDLSDHSSRMQFRQPIGILLQHLIEKRSFRRPEAMLFCLLTVLDTSSLVCGPLLLLDTDQPSPRPDFFAMTSGVSLSAPSHFRICASRRRDEGKIQSRSHGFRRIPGWRSPSRKRNIGPP